MNEQEKRYYGTSSAERIENEIEREHAHGQPAVPKREWEVWMVLTVAKEPRSFHPSQAGATHYAQGENVRYLEDRRIVASHE